MKTIIINEPELTPDQAWALAQFTKRLTWDGMRACAMNEEETYLIWDAIYQLQTALAVAGFAPR
ncbi:hypothetical protein LZ683_13175 [Comamonas testosteroni]|uniref:DUF7706 family protein n=1 Tax=Comamonas testosteroni TaxID=285 RepID=UPI0023AAE350|nr:hypothetical protein [Comamonas testosteroni]WEE80228.1 hypothetical protein LZ683_13175 [Comamonas testosteroni]